jgi:hypothetical protein
MDGLMGAPAETRRRESEGAERIVSQKLNELTSLRIPNREQVLCRLRE